MRLDQTLIWADLFGATLHGEILRKYEVVPIVTYAPRVVDRDDLMENSARPFLCLKCIWPAAYHQDNLFFCAHGFCLYPWIVQF